MLELERAGGKQGANFYALLVCDATRLHSLRCNELDPVGER